MLDGRALWATIGSGETAAGVEGSGAAHHVPLCTQHGQRRAQFVRGVGGETPLARQRRFDAHEKAVHRRQQRPQFGGATDAEARRQAEARLSAGLDRVDRLVTQMLALSRVEATERLSHSNAVDWPALVAQVMNDVLPLAERRGAELACDWPPDGTPPFALKGDADLLAVLLRNLLDNALRYAPAGSTVTLRFGKEGLALHNGGPPLSPEALARLPSVPVTLPAGTAKITFTSGSTGAPKGVCLSAGAMQRVARGLVEAMAPLGITRHLNALPFAVLLENIAGLMAPRLHGATVITRPLASLGLGGASQFDARRFDDAVRSVQPHSLILLPQMLRAWCGHLGQSGQRAPVSLKLVAVGGAAVGAPLIHAAQALGIPACEGYGLSEGASVQTLNLPAPAGAARAGSAGRALPHVRLRVAADGEVQIAGSLFSGYLGDTTPVPEWWPTGDLGRIDDDGVVYVRTAAGEQAKITRLRIGKWLLSP